MSTLPFRQFSTASVLFRPRESKAAQRPPTSSSTPPNDHNAYNPSDDRPEYIGTDGSGSGPVYYFPHVAGELKLRCTEFDSIGNVKTTAGEFSKSELCAVHGLQPRDLRKIDSKFVNQLPGILVRHHAILVNLVHIRAIIKADCVVLFDSLGSTDSYHQSLFIYDLQDKLRMGSKQRMALTAATAAKNAPANDNVPGTSAPSAESTAKTAAAAAASAYHAQLLPYEFRALEAALVSVISSLQSELDVLSNLVTNLLAHIEVSIDRDKLKELLQYSKRLSKFEQKTLSIRDAINDVLDQDEDLAGMYLTAKELGISRSIDDHEEVELLLETYLKQVEEIANSTSTLIQNMRSTEDIVNIILDSQRNSLLLLELRVAITTMGMSCGALIASMFGMNLESGLEHHPQAFYIVAGTMMAMVSTAALLVMRKMRMIKKF